MVEQHEELNRAYSQVGPLASVQLSDLTRVSNLSIKSS